MAKRVTKQTTYTLLCDTTVRAERGVVFCGDYVEVDGLRIITNGYRLTVDKTGIPLATMLGCASPKTVAAAKAEMARENEAHAEYYKRPDIVAQGEENNRRSNLPSEHPEHICGMRCDGQDGRTSDCWRLREKLGFHQR